MNEFGKYLNGYTKNKKVCILGYGREGKSTYRMLEKYCSCGSVTICDLNPVDREANRLPENVKIIIGEEYQASLNDFDIVFKSPGIVLKSSPSVLECEISSETQLFFEYFRSQIVGITGTKGKSTVSSLIYHILKESGKDCFLAGNIGIPVFDIAEAITDKSIIVCELSCHQLEYMTVSPHIAVMLNVYEEHLDHYGTMEKYVAAKENIYLHQEKYDILLCNQSIIPDKIMSCVHSISNTCENADIYTFDGKIFFGGKEKYKITTDRIRLLGIHNHYNIAAAYYISSLFDINDDEFTSAVCSFNPLAHRLEYVDTVNGIRYYDDSISTACATAIEAVKSVPNAGTILIGGMDRGIDYTDLIEFLRLSDINVICMEASGKRVYDIIGESGFKDAERIHYSPHLEQAVRLASKITAKGKSCVLSPAAASYGIFKNFEERGNAFKALVAGLKAEAQS